MSLNPQISQNITEALTSVSSVVAIAPEGTGDEINDYCQICIVRQN